MIPKNVAPRWLLCISNEGYPASLEERRVYRVVPDEEAERKGMVRILDESGEDYLYPRSRFEEVEGPVGLDA